MTQTRFANVFIYNGQTREETKALVEKRLKKLNIYYTPIPYSNGSQYAGYKFAITEEKEKTFFRPDNMQELLSYDLLEWKYEDGEEDWARTTEKKYRGIEKQICNETDIKTINSLLKTLCKCAGDAGDYLLDFMKERHTKIVKACEKAQKNMADPESSRVKRNQRRLMRYVEIIA
jgi:hypothetical protein